MIDDALLFEFRRAATIEPRLLSLEAWLEHDPPPFDSPAYWKRWAKSAARRIRLIQHNPRLAPHGDALHNYLISVYELAAKQRVQVQGEEAAA